jgi:cytidylate kinase
MALCRRDDFRQIGDVARHAENAVQDDQSTRFVGHALETIFQGCGGVVAEGRDMGTIIFPDARVKFFVEGRLEVRAGRRYAQLKGTPQASTLADISRDLSERDERDAERSIAPAKPAPGAVIVDNSDRSLDEVVEAMYHVVVGSGR